MYYRNELKFDVSDIDLKKIEYRLKPFMDKDAHQKDDFYLIRSIYFDDYDNTCFNDNTAGVDFRYKFRIRAYNTDSTHVFLEKKEKHKALTHKETSEVPFSYCLDYMNGQIPDVNMYEDNSDIVRELFIKSKTRYMMPKCIVEYERSAYVLNTGNVRITFDRNIRGTNNIDSFFNKRIDAVPILKTGHHILEIKYDEILPKYLLNAIDIGSLRQQTFSKYCQARLALGI